jgi:hypothetical protein
MNTGRIAMTLCLMLSLLEVSGQRLNVGLTFQYHILKQVKVDSDIIMGSNSYSVYNTSSAANRWKFFSAGQSFVIGSVFQLDYKKVYGVIEPSFDLNTYNYTVYYPLAPGRRERLNFQTLFLQVDVPLYVGFQFKSTNLLRYSVFAGGVAVLPYAVTYDLPSKEKDNPQYGDFSTRDMENIIYNDAIYANTIIGLCLHFANLGKFDLRYQHRLGSPGAVHKTTFNTIGFGLTYYLPVDLGKRKIYYED